MGTDSPTVALRRSHQVAAEIERRFEDARARLGLGVDHALLAEASPATTPLSGNAVEARLTPSEPASSTTLKELYDAYMADPTRDWSPRTRLAYDTTRKLVLAVFGEHTLVRSITRAQCRELIETLRWMPRHASKLYPGLDVAEITARAKEEGRTDLISPSNLNTYLNKLGGLFNWAVKEEMMDRNPAEGLRVPDAALRRDKRRPFSTVRRDSRRPRRSGSGPPDHRRSGLAR